MPEPDSLRNLEIARRILSGDTYQAIGNDLGITRQRVQQIAERHGVRPLRVDEKPLNAYELQTAQLLESEPRLSYHEVAAQVGLPLRQVRRIADKAKLSWMRQPVYRRGIRPWDYDEQPDTGCWLWRHGKSSRGHGRLNAGNGRSEYAHRFAYEKHYRPIPPGASVIHRCGNYACVNPEHLSLEGERPEGERDGVVGVAYERVTVAASEPPDAAEPTVSYDLALPDAPAAGAADDSPDPPAVTVALVYDFDSALATDAMQLNAELGLTPGEFQSPGEFRAEVDRLARDHQADEMLMAMYLLLRKAAERGAPVTREALRAQGRQLEFHPGVRDWFGRMQEYGAGRGVRVAHYIVSSSHAEVIEGTPLAGLVDGSHASRFLFDADGVAVWPALSVNCAARTEFLLSICQGAAPDDRPVPFENMVYLGNGATDASCCRLVKERGGLAVAVFAPETRHARRSAQQPVDEGHVHGAAPADYTADGPLDRLVKSSIELAGNRAALSRAIAAG